MNPRIEVYLNGIKIKTFKTTVNRYMKTLRKVYAQFNIDFPKNKDNLYFQNVINNIHCNITLAHITGGSQPRINMFINNKLFKKFKCEAKIPIKTLGKIMYNYNINPRSNHYYNALWEQIKNNKNMIY
jgi:hypothetical protein